MKLTFNNKARKFSRCMWRPAAVFIVKNSVARYERFDRTRGVKQTRTAKQYLALFPRGMCWATWNCCFETRE